MYIFDQNEMDHMWEYEILLLIMFQFQKIVAKRIVQNSTHTIDSKWSTITSNIQITDLTAA